MGIKLNFNKIKVYPKFKAIFIEQLWINEALGWVKCINYSNDFNEIMPT